MTVGCTIRSVWLFQIFAMATNDANEKKQPLSKLQSISKRFLNTYYIVNVLILSSYLVCAYVF